MCMVGRGASAGFLPRSLRDLLVMLSNTLEHNSTPAMLLYRHCNFQLSLLGASTFLLKLNPRASDSHPPSAIYTRVPAA